MTSQQTSPLDLDHLRINPDIVRSLGMHFLQASEKLRCVADRLKTLSATAQPGGTLHTSLPGSTLPQLLHELADDACLLLLAHTTQVQRFAKRTVKFAADVSEADCLTSSRLAEIRVGDASLAELGVCSSGFGGAR